MKAERVLVIQLKRVGDVLLCTPVLRALREDSPPRRIVFLTEEANVDVLRGNPHVDEILTIPPQMGLREWMNLHGRLRREGAAVAIDFPGTPRSCLIATLTGAPVRVGFHVRAPRRWAYTHTVAADSERYTVDRRLDLLRVLGIPDRGLATELYLGAEDKTEAGHLLDAAGFDPRVPLLAIAPASRKDAKRWTAEGYASVAIWAREELGADVLLLSGPGEEDQEDQVRRVLPRGARKLPRVPGLRVLAALIERCRALLANDGGLKHMAVALGVPTVTVFVSTKPLSWHPPDEPRHVAVMARGDLSAEIREAVDGLRRVWVGSSR